VKPDLIVALGATAARGLMRRTVTISRVRGEVLDLPEGWRGLVTIHPSWLLRMEDEVQKEAEYRRFVGDLQVARKALSGH